MNAILLIAEQAEITETFTAMLSPVFNVLSADTEEKGQQMLKENGRDIVAVLIELALARRNGFVFADSLNDLHEFSPIPMIAISDELPQPQDMDCLKHGFFDLITAYAPEPLVYKRISNAVRAKDSLSLSQVEKMLKELPACIFLKDEQGRYVFSTQYWRHLETGGDPNWTIRGKTDMEVRRDKDNARKAMEADRRILETGVGTDYVIEENEDGIQEFLQLIKRPVRDESGRISGIIALINNVTDYQLLKAELEKRAKTDSLTGLLNKSAAQELIRMLLSTSRKEEERFALLVIDIDRFKQVNDGFGHAAGDSVLAEVGRIIKNSCRGPDVGGRIGGDEFIILMRNINTAENALQLAGRISKQIEDAFPAEPCVTVSIGISVCPEHGSGYEELFRAADAALYEVKKNGRAAYRLADCAGPES